MINYYNKSALAGTVCGVIIFLIPAYGEAPSKHFKGKASWYGSELHGHRTASGVTFDKDKMTAAHRTLPFGTKVLVKNCKNGRTCIVEIRDRGPHISGRVLDVSRSAAKELGIVSSGIGEVECQVLSKEDVNKIAANINYTMAPEESANGLKKLISAEFSADNAEKIKPDEVDADLKELLTPDESNQLFMTEDISHE